MINLLNELPKIKERIKHTYVCIFLDYDGTLTEIADKPEYASLSADTKNRLKKLAKNPNCQIVIVSGRTLKNIKSNIGIENIIYVGGHGVEFGGLHHNFALSISLSYKKLLKKIKKLLTTKLSAFDGVFLEDKKNSLCLHYRLADKKSIHKIKKIFRSVIATPFANKELNVLHGKKVFEIVSPDAWNKGKIVLMILALLRCTIKHKKITSFYIGDDITDEDAFYSLKKVAITARVEKNKHTHAKYYLKNTNDVKIFLEEVNNFINSH